MNQQGTLTTIREPLSPKGALHAHRSKAILGLAMFMVMLFPSAEVTAAEESAPAAARLPAGPAEASRFGAFYTRLRYEPAWERAWRVGDHPDVLVTFAKMPVRFVFWRGTSMIPCWVSENGIWYTNEFVERFGGGVQGCPEPMSDKQCRYSHVRILESTPARVVIHWRYSPVDVFYKQPWIDKQTGWGDWVDEYYTIYADGVGVRKLTLYSSAVKERTEFFESIVINPPGTFPEANIEPGAVTVANLAGESTTWRWTERASPEKPEDVPQACIHRMNLKAKYSPFAIFPEGGSFVPYSGHEPGRLFHFWNHWPVSQDKSWTTVAESADKPSHSSFSHYHDWPIHTEKSTSVTRVMLHGMSDRPIEHLVRLGRSWLKPAACTMNGRDQELPYDPAQRAYVLADASAESRAGRELSLQASPESPVINPAFLFRNWGEAGISVKLDGKELVEGEDFHAGHVPTLEGTDLIVWVEGEADRPLKLELTKQSLNESKLSNTHL